MPIVLRIGPYRFFVMTEQGLLAIHPGEFEGTLNELNISQGRGQSWQAT